MSIDIAPVATPFGTILSHHHGVPHVAVPAPGPVRARLMFRAGMVDETLQQRGLTHLVEHLVLRSLGRRHFEVNGHTGAWTTGFEARGTDEDVTRFVEDVWAALADLPTEALDLERRVMRHEAAGRSVSPVVDAVHHRFGLTGPGRLWADELGLRAATPDSVRQWATERFTRSAAALASTKEIRPDLSVDLGPGPVRPVPTAVAARGGQGPVWVGDAAGTAVSLLLPSAHGTDLAVGRLLLDAAENAVRHERALAYEVALDCIGVSPDITEVAVYAACEPAEQAEVAGLLVDALRRLRDSGPDEGALDLDRRASRDVWGGTADELELAAESALSMLLGQTPRSVTDRVRDLESLDVSRVREAVREAWPTVQVLLPVQEAPGIADVRECEHDDLPVDGRTHRGNPLAGLLPGAKIPLPLGASLTCGDEGLTLRLRGEVYTVRWDRVAAVLREPGSLTVVGHDGVSVLVPDGTFFGWRRVRRAIEQRVGPDVFLDAPA